MPIRGSPNGANHLRPQAGRDRLEQVVAINWNAWSQSIGTAGRNHPVRACISEERVSAALRSKNSPSVILVHHLKPCDAAARVCERSATEPLPQSARQCGHSRPLRSLKDSRRRWIAEAMRSSVVTHHRCRNKKSVIQ